MNPDPKVDQVQKRHYQRFLYRVERFSSLFDWFHVTTSDHFEHWRHRNQKFFLNVAGDVRSRPQSAEAALSPASPEHELECRLLKDPDFDRHYKFTGESIKDRQFPVGLFSESTPTAASAVFPGGKGAIDLVCVDRHHLWLFELKAKKNIPIGTIAELFFYVSVMRDAVIGNFQFGRAGGSRANVQTQMIENVKKITGVMLGHDLHPLISDPNIIHLLNNALADRWNCIGGAPDVSFRADQIQSDLPLKIVECGQ